MERKNASDNAIGGFIAVLLFSLLGWALPQPLTTYMHTGCVIISILCLVSQYMNRPTEDT